MIRYISMSVIDCLKQEYTKRKFQIILSIFCCSHKKSKREIERSIEKKDRIEKKKERKKERRIERKKEEIGIDLIKENDR